MTIRYLLDTNILSGLIRNPGGAIAERISQVGESTIFTSIVVAAELRFGAKKRNSAKLTARVDAILSTMEIMPIEEPVDRIYAELRADLEARGEMIGPNDMLIAAHALALECAVVTANEREFSRIKTLQVENWLAT